MAVEPLLGLPETLKSRNKSQLNQHDIVNLARVFEDCVAYQWKEFAIKFLELNLAHIQNIDEDHNYRAEKIHCMFQKWKELNQDIATVQNINEILHETVPGIKEMWWNLYRERNSQKSFSDMKDKIINYIKNIADYNIPLDDWSRIVNQLNLEGFQRNHEGNRTNNIFLQRSNILQVWVQTKGFGHATIPKLQECFKKVKVPIELPTPEIDAQRPIHKAYEQLLSEQWDLIFNEKLSVEQKRFIVNDLMQNENTVTKKRLEKAFEQVRKEENKGFHRFMEILGKHLKGSPEDQHKSVSQFFQDSNYRNLFRIKNFNVLAPHFTKYKYYTYVEKSLDSKRHLYLHGRRGSGKSQLASAYAKRFSKLHPTSIIWTIECQDRVSVDGALLSLRHALSSGHLLNGEHLDWDGVVKLIRETETPVLLILEQVNADTMGHGDLKKILHSLEPYEKSYVIASSIEKIEMSKKFDQYKVKGFTLDESVAFLENLENRDTDEEAGAKQIAKCFSCLPLGLAPARAYCNDTGIPYSDFFTVMQEEKRFMNISDELHDNLLATMTICLNSIGTCMLRGDTINLRQVFTMAAFFHSENIPVYLFKQAVFKQAIKPDSEMTVPFTEIHKKVAILQLFKYLMKFTLVVVREGHDLNLRSISMHSIVQEALVGMIKRQSTNNQQLLMALYCLSCYFQKDNRLHVQHDQLLVLLPHVTKALSLASKPDSFTPKFDSHWNTVMQQMITIRLLEVKGFACTQNGSAEDANEPLKQAHDQLLGLICAQGGIELKNLTSIAEKRILNTTAQDSVIKAEATILLQLCIKAVAQISAETFDQLIQTMVLNEEDIELLKRNASEWKSQLNPNTPLTDTDIEELRNHNLALTADELKSVYLAEQLASILYTRGRLMFYRGFDQSRKEECIKFIKLAFYVAKEVARQTGIKLLHYLIAETNGLLYLKLALNNKSDDQKRQDYGDAYRRYERLSLSENKYFEHGILKEDGKTSYHVMRCYKQMISAKMQQLKIPGKKLKDNWFEVCDKLDKIVDDHPSFGKTATEGLIIAGELCCTGEKYEKALELFKKAMDRVKDKEQSYKKELFTATEKFTETALSAYKKSDTESNRNWCVEAIERCEKAKLLVPHHERSLDLQALSDRVTAILQPREPAFRKKATPRKKSTSKRKSASNCETGPSNKHVAKSPRKF